LKINLKKFNNFFVKFKNRHIFAIAQQNSNVYLRLEAWQSGLSQLS
jgi:hypothetical protein